MIELNPSIFLLFLKICGIFIFCWCAGALVLGDIFEDQDILKPLLYMIIGAVVINLSMATAIIIHLPGSAGLIGLGALLFVRIKDLLHKLKNTKKLPTNPFIWASILMIFNYTAPFWSQGTSGLYARGGGDHSTYLGLSEYFVKNSLWNPIAKTELEPPSPFWEVKTYPVSMQKFLSSFPDLDLKHNLPLGNQMIATGFIALLPGESDETYTAAVAFYLSMACCSIIALCFVLSGGWTGRSWLAFILLPLSNLLLFPAGTQSIPFIFAISILNTLFLVIYQVNLNTNKSIFSGALPAGILAAGLLTIYPFLFPILLAYVPIFILIKKNINISILFYVISFLIITITLTHIYLFINVPLIMFGAAVNTPLYPPMGLLQILATQSGIIDFLCLASNKQMTSKEYTAIVFVIISIIFAAYAICKKNQRKMFAFASLFVCFAGAGIFYNFKEPEGHGGYQMVRLGVLSHTYLLGLAGLGLSFWLNEGRAKKVVCTIVLLTFSFFLLRERITIVKQIISNPHPFATEFRDSFAYRIREFVKQEQKKEMSKKINRVVYYFGHGDGTDFGGSTVFLRSLYALNSFNLEKILSAQGKTLWNKDWLNNAFLLYCPINQNEIINDKRSNNLHGPILANERMALLDSKNEKRSAVLGESWNYPIKYTTDNLHTSFRYLRGKTGVLVIWTNEQENVFIKIKTSADTSKSFLKIRSQENHNEWKTKVNFWEGNYNQVTDFTISTVLYPGPNVFEFQPEHNHGLNPWLLIFEINIHKYN